MSRDLKLVVGAMLTWGLGEGIFYIFQPLYLQEFGADPILIGTILGINGLVMAIVQIPAGHLADKVGTRPLMRFGWITGVIAAWIMALAPSLSIFVAGLLLYRLTASVMAPLNAYVQGARGKWSVGRAVSFTSAAYNFGGIIGPIIGGVVGEVFHLRTAYYLAGAIFTISTFILMFADKRPAAHLSPVEGEAHLFKNKPFLVMLGLIFLVMFAVTIPQPLTANFLQNQRGISLSHIGQLGSVAAFGSVILMLVFGHLQSGAAMMIGQAGMMIFSILLWRGTNLIWYGIGYFFLGGYKLCRTMSIALVRPIVREREVGLAFGVVESLIALAFMAAPLLAGFLYDWQPSSVFQVGLGVMGVSFLLSVYFVQKNRKSNDQFEETPSMEQHDEA